MSPPPISWLPFISQIATVPLVFWNAMSLVPLPKKSPAVIACQLVPGLTLTMLAAELGLMTVVPFISQIASWPVLVFCQRMSLMPS